MPVPKRWFPCNRDLNDDPEVWELTEQFGDRSLRILIEVLAILDKTENQWRISGQVLASISRKVRQTPANVRRAILWMVEKRWLTVHEQAADGSPIVVSATNYWKYHRRREPKAETSSPQAGSQEVKDKAPLLDLTSLDLTNQQKKEGDSVALGKPSATHSTGKGSVAKLSDAEFIEKLKTNAAYAGIDIDREIGKLHAWLLTPKGAGKKLTRQRLVNWLNGCDKPMNGTVVPIKPPKKKCEGLVDGKQPCPSYAVDGSRFCQGHREYYAKIQQKKQAEITNGAPAGTNPPQAAAVMELCGKISKDF